MEYEREYEANNWYWVTDPREGDVWHPVFVREKDVLWDGNSWDLHIMTQLLVVKSVMPD